MITFENISQEDIIQYTKPTVTEFLKCLHSAIALDVAPNHTGIVIWNGATTEEYGFKLTEPNKKDYHWLYLLRKEFKAKLKELLQGKHFEHCIIEDIYGGENYDTMIQLAELNDVIDEVIDDGICTVDNFYRWKPTEWMSKARLIYKQDGKLKSKVETQGLLEYLEYDFYLKYKDNPESEKEAKKLGVQTKKELFFEDICDSCGMLLAVASYVWFSNDEIKQGLKPLKITDIKIVFVEHLEDCLKLRDKRLKEDEKKQVEVSTRNIEGSILEFVKNNANTVMYSEFPVAKLGTFGIKRNFTFYESGTGYLVFYKKQSKKV